MIMKKTIHQTAGIVHPNIAIHMPYDGIDVLVDACIDGFAYLQAAYERHRENATLENDVAKLSQASDERLDDIVLTRAELSVERLKVAAKRRKREDVFDFGYACAEAWGRTAPQS